jgi:hypothetical protein
LGWIRVDYGGLDTVAVHQARHFHAAPSGKVFNQVAVCHVAVHSCKAVRIDRLGSTHEEISIHNFFPEEGLDDLLGLMERLADKIETINRNVGLEASILGEKVNPREFNALRRIEDEDQSVTGELEAEVEVSGEFIRQVLADHLKRYGRGSSRRASSYQPRPFRSRDSSLAMPFQEHSCDEP